MGTDTAAAAGGGRRRATHGRRRQHVQTCGAAGACHALPPASSPWCSGWGVRASAGWLVGKRRRECSGSRGFLEAAMRPPMSVCNAGEAASAAQGPMHRHVPGRSGRAPVKACAPTHTRTHCADRPIAATFPHSLPVPKCRMAKLQPTVLWAQRADRLLLTIDLQQCKDPQIRWGAARTRSAVAAGAAAQRRRRRAAPLLFRSLPRPPPGRCSRGAPCTGPVARPTASIARLPARPTAASRTMRRPRRGG